MVAQNYADKCVFAHNSQRADQAPSFVTVGENLFVTQSQNVNYTAFVQAWHSEVKKYDYVSNTCSTVCGHYKQVYTHPPCCFGCMTFATLTCSCAHDKYRWCGLILTWWGVEWPDASWLLVSLNQTWTRLHIFSWCATMDQRKLTIVLCYSSIKPLHIAFSSDVTTIAGCCIQYNYAAAAEPISLTKVGLHA